MGKMSDKERQAKRREKLKQDDRAYQSYLKKDQMRKKLKRIADKKNPKPEQDAHKAAERVRIRKYRLQKKEREQALILTQTPIQSPYNTKQ